MSKIGELIAERNRIKTAHASMPVLPTWNARVGFDDDGKLNVADYTIRNVSEFIAWLNEWYATPAPAKHAPATGWLCEATDKPGTRRNVVVLCQREYPTCAYFSDGKWWESSSKLRLNDVTHWQELPAMPTA